MFRTVFDWFESRIPAFAAEDRKPPPAAFGAFVLFYMRPVWPWLAILFVSSLLLASTESGLIVATGWFVDLLAGTRPESIGNERAVGLAAAAVVVLILRPLAVSFNETLVNQTVSLPLTMQVCWRSHLHILGHAVADFQNEYAGRIADRVNQVGPALRSIALQTLDAAVYVLVYVSVIIVAFSAISGWLAVPVLLWIAACAGVARWFVPRLLANSMLRATAQSGLSGCIVDTYTNILTVKLFAGREVECSAVRGAMVEYLTTYRAGLRLLTAESVLLAFANTMLLVAVAAMAAWLWSVDRITPGETAAGLALVMRLFSLSGWFIQEIRSFFEQIGLVRDSMRTIARPHALVDRAGAGDLVVSSGEIVFEAVRFRHGSGPVVIDGLDLVIRPGEKVGLVGASGAGKSTLIALLLRLHDRDSGRILIDGQDVASVTQDSLRRHIGMVSQDVSLFNRSVRDNIAYGRPLATDAEVENAARLARADAFIDALVDDEGRRGFEAHVGERGVKLSGGQRQRIAIARALLKDAPILVLDEATAAIDYEAEAAMRDGLADLLRRKTVIAIAHRKSTIAALDRLAVLDHGRIVETGTHDALVASGGIYAGLWHNSP